jgi:hypothetical protein
MLEPGEQLSPQVQEGKQTCQELAPQTGAEAPNKAAGGVNPGRVSRGPSGEREGRAAPDFSPSFLTQKSSASHTHHPLLEGCIVSGEAGTQVKKDKNSNQA